MIKIEVKKTSSLEEFKIGQIIEDENSGIYMVTKNDLGNNYPEAVVLNQIGAFSIGEIVELDDDVTYFIGTISLTQT